MRRKRRRACPSAIRRAPTDNVYDYGVTDYLLGPGECGHSPSKSVIAMMPDILP